MTVPLAHVLWIGGATDAGKTSAARTLAERYGLQAYHYDRYDRLEAPGHWARIEPERHPHMQAIRAEDPDWMWVDTTPAGLVERWLDTTPERFSLTLEDLRALPDHPPIVAEGYGLTPELVSPLLTSPRQAVWLIPTESFKRATYQQRGKGTFAGTREPALARFNHIERDLLLGAIIRRQATERGCTLIEVDGARTLSETFALIEAHMAPYLRLLGCAAPQDG